MFFVRRILVCCCALLAAGLAPPGSATEPLLGSRPGVALLHNGHVLEGRISREGNQIVVSLGDKGELRLAESRVRMICANLREAYQVQRQQVDPTSPEGHVELARWCLRHGLFVLAAAEVERARQLDPSAVGLDSTAQQIELASRGPATQSVSSAPHDPAKPVVASQPVVEHLPEEAIEQFTSHVQPLLLNRCATAGCHGPVAESTYQLQRSVGLRSLLRQTTMANLHATLRTIDRQTPVESPLLKMARSDHAQSGQPVFAPHESDLYQQLEDWVELVTAKPAGEAGISPAGASRLLETPSIVPPRPHRAGDRDRRRQPAGEVAGLEDVEPTAASTRAGNGPAASGRRPPADRPPQKSARPSNPAGPFRPRDPFDPEIFNRRYFPDHKH